MDAIIGGGDLPELGLELDPLDRSKVQLLQILEWFQVCCNDAKFGLQDGELHAKLLSWLSHFDPTKDLMDNVWLERVRDSRDFRLLIKSIKKEPSYAEYFARVITKRGDGYESGSLDAKTDGDDIEIVADSLFLQDEDVAYRVLGIKSPYQCVDCDKTDCELRESNIQGSTSPETLCKLFTLLLDNDKLLFRNVLVLGSGIGSVAFCTYVYVKECKILSCEEDVKQYNLQVEVVKKHHGGMEGRLRVDNCLIPSDAEVIKSIDLVLMCERLLLKSEDEQREVIFMRLRKWLKSGTRLVLYKRIEDWIASGRDCDANNAAKVLQKCKEKMRVDVDDWLVLEHELCITNDEYLYYHVYKVL